MMAAADEGIGKIVQALKDKVSNLPIKDKILRQYLVRALKDKVSSLPLKDKIVCKESKIQGCSFLWPPVGVWRI